MEEIWITENGKKVLRPGNHVPEDWRNAWLATQRLINSGGGGTNINDNCIARRKFVEDFYFLVGEQDEVCIAWLINRLVQIWKQEPFHRVRTEVLVALPKAMVNKCVGVGLIMSSQEAGDWLKFLWSAAGADYAVHASFLYFVISSPLHGWASKMAERAVMSSIEDREDGKSLGPWVRAHSVAQLCNSNEIEHGRVRFIDKEILVASKVLLLLEDVKSVYKLLTSLMDYTTGEYSSVKYAKASSTAMAILEQYDHEVSEHFNDGGVGKKVGEACYVGGCLTHIRVNAMENARMFDWWQRLHAFAFHHKHSPVIGEMFIEYVLSPRAKFYFKDEDDVLLAAKLVFTVVWTQVHGQCRDVNVNNDTKHKNCLRIVATNACWKYAKNQVSAVPPSNFEYRNFDFDACTEHGEQPEHARFDAMMSYLMNHHGRPFYNARNQDLCESDIKGTGYGNTVQTVREWAKAGVFSENGYKSQKAWLNRKEMLRDKCVLLPHYRVLWTVMGESMRGKKGKSGIKGKDGKDNYMVLPTEIKDAFFLEDVEEDRYPQKWREGTQGLKVLPEWKNRTTAINALAGNYKVDENLLFQQEGPQVLTVPLGATSPPLNIISPLMKRSAEDCGDERSAKGRRLSY